MDDETRQAFADLIAKMNDQHERLLERINALAHDFQNTKGFLIEDAIVTGRRVFNAENRLDKGGL